MCGVVWRAAGSTAICGRSGGSGSHTRPPLWHGCRGTWIGAGPVCAAARSGLCIRAHGPLPTRLTARFLVVGAAPANLVGGACAAGCVSAVWCSGMRQGAAAAAPALPPCRAPFAVPADPHPLRTWQTTSQAPDLKMRALGWPLLPRILSAGPGHLQATAYDQLVLCRFCDSSSPLCYHCLITIPVKRFIALPRSGSAAAMLCCLDLRPSAPRLHQPVCCVEMTPTSSKSDRNAAI